MPIFEDYAKYYNLLYRDKNYKKEVDFVYSLIRKYAPTANSILEIGCGTGQHGKFLANKGYNITGVDSSETMLEIAKFSIESSNPPLSNINFLQADIRFLQIARKFDAVLSLFHVMSYQTRNDDLKAVLNTVKNHLHPNGIFIFDFWYGPAVLMEKPSVRVKYMEDDEMKITRIAEPSMHPNDNIVDVNYTVLISDKQNGKIKELKETHRMRYMFLPEIMMLASTSQFELCEIGEWITSKEPGFDTWNVYCVLKPI